MTFKVLLCPTNRTTNRQLYEARLEGEGTPIVSASWDSDSDVCRALEARGETGRVEFWWAGKSFASLIVHDLVKHAKTQTSEPARGPLTRRKFEAMPTIKDTKAAVTGTALNVPALNRLAI